MEYRQLKKDVLPELKGVEKERCAVLVVGCGNSSEWGQRGKKKNEAERESYGSTERGSLQ